LQPVYVGDVAEATVTALAAPAARGKIYEIGGPRIYTYKELLQLVLTETDRRRLLIPVPFFVWDLLALLTSPLPQAPVSRDQVTLMKRDNVVDGGALSLHELGIVPKSLEQFLKSS
jgi:NADH dehydrogenase